MLFLQHHRKEKRGQIGQRHKTIILLRVSTFTKPPEGARGQRRGSDGPYRAFFIWAGRTQQNDIGFVALAGVSSRKGRSRIGIKVSSLQFPESTPGAKARAGRAHIS